MKAVLLLMTIGLIVSAAWGSPEPAEELSPVRDEIEFAVPDVNTVTERLPDMTADRAPDPNRPADIPTVANATLPPDPNALETPADPNAVGSITVGTGSVMETETQAAVEKSRQLRREFFRVQLEPVETMTSEEQQQKLDELITQVSSLEPVKKLVVVPEDPKTAEGENTSQPDLPQTVTPSAPITPAAQSADVTKTVSSSVLSELEKVEQVVDPMQLADALYRQGHAPAAYSYYRQASERLLPEDAEAMQWVLFQMANCLRDSDPEKALEVYADLLARFPNSRWSPAAQSRRNTLEWITNESVRDFVTEAPDAD